MKKFSLLIAVVCLCVCAAIAQSPSEGVQIGPNVVEVTARHANGTIFYHHVGHNLKTTWGIDWISAMIGSNTAQQMFQYIDLSTDSTSPSASDCVSPNCTLTGVITNNGLAPATMSWIHTSGTNTFTWSNTWTATGTVSNVQKAAVSLTNYTGTSSCGGSGICAYAFENTFTPVTLNANDQISVTWTVTIS